MEKTQYMSTIQAAKLLGVSVRTIQQWVDAGKLDAWVSPGGHRKIKQTSVEDMMRQCSTTPPAQERKSILIVEDDADLILLYKLNLKKWGLPIDARYAANGYMALVEIGRQVPDLLITDLSMPEVDGFKMLQTLENEGIHFPTIVITGLPKERVAELGKLADDLLILTKPVDFDLLRRLVATTLDLRRPQASEATA